MRHITPGWLVIAALLPFAGCRFETGELPTPCIDYVCDTGVDDTGDEDTAVADADTAVATDTAIDTEIDTFVETDTGILETDTGDTAVDDTDTLPDTDIVDDTDLPHECEIGEVRCVGNTLLEECSDLGWIQTNCNSPEACSAPMGCRCAIERADSGDTGYCEARECIPDTTRCADGTVSGREICNAAGSAWELDGALDCDESQRCIGGECVDVDCPTPGPYCEGTSRALCTDAGEIEPVEDCFSVEAYCLEEDDATLCEPWECLPWSTRCSDDSGGVETCADTGEGFGDAVACRAEYSCVEGNCVRWLCVPGEIICGWPEGVTSGAKHEFTCTDLGRVEGDGVTCEAGSRCLAGVGCTEGAGCTPGTTRCGADNMVERCSVDGYAWDAVEQCPAPYDICLDIAGEAACSSCAVGSPSECAPRGGGFASTLCQRIESTTSYPLYDTVTTVCPFACADNVCAVCEPDTERCVGDASGELDSNGVETCAADGSAWELSACDAGDWCMAFDDALRCVSCEPGTQLCEDIDGTLTHVSCSVLGTRTPTVCTIGCDPATGCFECEPGAMRCAEGDGVVETCVAGFWETSDTCADGDSCLESADGPLCGVCVPGTRFCADDDASFEVCDSAGQWGDPVSCTHGCTDGFCNATATCGDGFRSPSEQCDDGNEALCDGCETSACLIDRYLQTSSTTSTSLGDALVLGVERTVEAWVRFDGSGAAAARRSGIFGLGARVDDIPPAGFYLTAEGVIYTDGGRALGSGEEITLTSLADGAWHHLAVTRHMEGPSLLVRVLVDGVVVATDNPTAGSEPDAGVYAWIGQLGGGSTSAIFALDSLRISEVLRYEVAGTVPPVRLTADDDTVALYQFDDEATAFAYDATVNAHDLTVQNTTRAVDLCESLELGTVDPVIP